MSKNYVELKVSDLREECKKRNLEATGLKVHLVERLTKYDKDILNLENVKVVEKKAPEQLNDVNDVNDTKNETKNENADSKAVKSSSDELKKNITVKSASKVKLPSLFERASSEPDNWESRTDVHLDFYNSDLHLVIDSSGFSAQPISENGFEYMFAGTKANYGIKSGKVFFEVKIVKKFDIRLESDVGDSNVIRVGWSSNNSSLGLGEEVMSFAFDNSGKKLSNNASLEYGASIKEGDIIGSFLEFLDDTFILRFSVNGVDQGEAFNINTSDLNDQFLLPHICVRNMTFDVNFGVNNDASFPPKTGVDAIDDLTWTLLGKVTPTDLIRSSYPPKCKADCEVLMMCGLPSCGKTTWVDKTTKHNLEKFYNILSTNVILDKMKVMNLRKKCVGSRWDTFIQSATQCLNKLMEIAVTRRRNFILDQTNVYPTAQRRRMKTFEEFIRKAIIIVPTDDEYQRRMNQVITEEGKDVPESAVLQMKENFVIPEENSDLFKEIIFIELQRTEAEELVKKYNEEAKSKKKADEHNNKRPEREETSSFGLWNDSPKKTDVDTSGPPASKKSRWNEDNSEDKSSKSRDHDRKSSSSSHATRKSDYKGGFCFAREADDTDKAPSRSSYRSEDKYESKDRSRSKDQKSDRYSGRSGATNDSRRDRDRTDERRGRSRERVSEQRGGYGQSKDRSSRGGYNDRRPSSTYDGAESRDKYPRADYGGSATSRSTFESQEPRVSRFQVGQPLERGDARGRGRGGPQGSVDMRGGNTSRGSYGQMSGIGAGGYQQKYSEFNPYETASRYQDSQDYDYKSASDYDSQLSQDTSVRGGRTGFGVPRQPTAAAVTGQTAGRTVGGRWGGVPTNYDAGQQSVANYGPSSLTLNDPSYDDDQQYGGMMDSIDHYGGGYSDPKPRGGAVSGGGMQARGSGVGRGGYPHKTDDKQRFPNQYETGNAPYYGDKAGTEDANTKLVNPYDSKPPYFNKPMPDTAKFANPYDQKPDTRYSNKSDTVQKNPYDIKAATPGSRFSNPYDTNVGQFSDGYNEITKAANPYESKSVPVGYKGEEQTKFTNPYDTKLSSYQQGGYYNKSLDSTASAKTPNLYNSKSGPSTGSYGPPVGGEYEEYMSYDSTGGNQDKDYYDYYSEGASQSNYGVSTGTATGSYNKPPIAGSTVTGQSSGSFKAPPTGSYNPPYSATFKAPVSGAYNASVRGSFNAPVKAPYNAQSTGAYNSQPSGASNAAYNTLSGGAYNTVSGGAYNAASGGAYNVPSSGANSAVPSGAYSTPSRLAYNAESGAAYNATSGGGYNAVTSGAYTAAPGGTYNAATGGAYNAASGGAYNAATGGAYNAASGGAYNAASGGAYNAASGGAYNAATGGASGGAYNAAPGGAYNTATGGAYNAASGGAYKAPLSTSYNTASSGGYSGTSGGPYSSQSTVPYKAPASGAYNTSSSGAYNSKPSTGSYPTASAPYGSYTNTATGAYGNQLSGTYSGGNNPKSSSSDSKGNPVTAGGSFTNPYSNCYENPSGNSSAAGYDYYGQGPAIGTVKSGSDYGSSKQLGDKVVPGAAATGTTQPGYDDYSQYYGQY